MLLVKQAIIVLARFALRSFALACRFEPLIVRFRLAGGGCVVTLGAGCALRLRLTACLIAGFLTLRSLLL
jgi:hypothetical protein